MKKKEHQFPHNVLDWDLEQEKGAEAGAETHLHRHNFDLHIRRQLHFRLETLHHGNQQMNSG